MNIIRWFLLLFIVTLSQLAITGGASLAGKVEDIQQVIEGYHRSEGLKSRVKKEVYQFFSEEVEASEGIFLLKQGTLRVEFQKPRKTILVMSPHRIWYEEPLSEGFQGKQKVKVTKIKTSEALKKSNGVLALFLGRKSVWESLRLDEVKAIKGQRVYTLRSAKEDSPFLFEKIEVSLDRKKKKIISLKYWDALENTVTFKFRNIDLKAKISLNKLKYTPPTSALITEI